MKAVIWIGCFIAATILNVLVGYATGFRFGYVIFYLAVYFAAKKLCDKWDEHQAAKAKQEQVAAIADNAVAESKVGETPRRCGICGEELLENSRFCRKCGAEVVMIPTQRLMGIVTANTSAPNPDEDETTDARGNNTEDRAESVAPQVKSGWLEKVTATELVLAAVIVVVCALFAGYAFDAQGRIDVNRAEVSRLENEVDTLQEHVDAFEEEIDEKQSTVTSLENEIDNLKEEVSDKQATITLLEEQIYDLRNKSGDLTIQNFFNQRKLDFYDDYVALVNENSTKYHRYGCDDFDSSGFWVYSVNGAIYEGYSPCPKCH